MTWKTLRDALEMAAACGFAVDGEDRTAIRSLRPKRAASTKPAAKSFREDTLPAKEVDTDRCMTIANPNELPRSAVVIHLVVDNSGRSPAWRRDNEAPAFRRNSWRERARETGLVLVHSAASRTCVCEAAS
jgi:hypothetical protein